MFNNQYKGKRVLLTGHTGFKGSWMTAWLLKLGANVCGLSDRVPTTPSMFLELGLEKKIEHYFCDIRDFDGFSKVLNHFKPDYVFHLAAQPIVSSSYEDPLKTISTNVMGTSVLLEALRQWNQPCNVVVVTSDKCYENVEWIWGYKETDSLGGKDIYSGSKGAAEVIFHAYYHSFFIKNKSKIKLATGRAGNVIGGGDWAKDRIVVDCIKNWSAGEMVEIRSPNSTRPWQHVLEPISGYLALGVELSRCDHINGESFNFGPRFEKSRSVLELIKDLSEIWFEKDFQLFKITDDIEFHEAKLLKLNCEKAMYLLDWDAVLTYEECVNFVGNWYKKYYKSNTNMFDFTLTQISMYENFAVERNKSWTKLINKQLNT